MQVQENERVQDKDGDEELSERLCSAPLAFPAPSLARVVLGVRGYTRPEKPFTPYAFLRSSSSRSFTSSGTSVPAVPV